ncbi:hypothetical protein [Glutamicibacter sp. NPDC087344]|uniref:hypothetical protein n=1 Tax=Glutamicibacter sp. NPDC087344 TaxID=3363994 RepID=UPI00380E70FC
MLDDSYGKLIGPVYSLAALATLWDCSEQEAARRAERLSMLALQVGDRKLYPSFQLDGAEPREDVLEAAFLLSLAGEHETAALWLVTACCGDRLGRTHLQLLDLGERRQVVAEAAETASRWADERELTRQKGEQE